MSSSLSGAASIGFQVSGTGRVISNFALTHFSAAIEFAEKTAEIEAAHTGQAFGNFWQEISIYWSAAIMSSVAALESLINELYLQTDSPLQNVDGDFDDFFWGRNGLERKPILQKYQAALAQLGVEPFDQESEPYAAVETLIGLRNYIVHFKPLFDEERRNADLEAQLVDRFQLSPFPDDGADFVTKKCVSGGCARWGVETSSSYIRAFADLSGLDNSKLSAFF